MKRQSLKYRIKVYWIRFSNFFRKTHIANICGHTTPIKGRITVFEESYTMKMPLSDNGKPDYCLDCIGKMSIRCAWCGNPISIGDPVTLYLLGESERPAEHAVAYKKDPRCFVGCLGWDCANSGADRQGFWMPPGEVERCLSPLELAMKPGVSMVIVPDLSKGSDHDIVLRDDRN